MDSFSETGPPKLGIKSSAPTPADLTSDLLTCPVKMLPVQEDLAPGKPAYSYPENML